MMSTYVVEEIQAKVLRLDSEGTQFAYFFCAARDRHRSSALSILRAWVYQLAQRDRYLQKLRSFFTARGVAHSKILGDFSLMWQAFVDILNDSSTTKFVLLVDALDECSKQERVRLLTHFLRLEPGIFQGRLRLILTCRSQHHFLPVELDPTQRIYMEGSHLHEDIGRVVAARVDMLHQYKSYDPQLKRAIKSELLARSSGSHLWVSLAVRELERISSSQALRRLVAIPRDLFAFYDEILCRVPAAHAAEVRFLLHLRLVALGDLTAMDIAVARSLVSDNTSSHTNDLQFLANDVIRPSGTEVWERKGRFETCTDLVTFDTHGKVDFIHPTVADYLLQQPSSQLAHLGPWVMMSLVIILVAVFLNTLLSKLQLCPILLQLVVLSRSLLESKPHGHKERSRALSVHMYQYIRPFSRTVGLWLVRQVYCTDLEHANFSAFQVAFQSLPTSSFGVEERYDDAANNNRKYAKKSLYIHASRCRNLLDQSSLWQATFSQSKSVSLELWLKQEALHGGKLLNKIIKTGVNLDTCIPLSEEDVMDSVRTPLIVAAMNDNTESVSSLLTAGATVDFQDRDALTALHHAVLSQHTQVVNILLAAGADVNIVDSHGDPPFISVLKQQTGLQDTLYENFAIDGDSIAFVGDIDVVNTKAMGNSVWLNSMLRFQNPQCEALIAALVEHGADLAMRDHEGRTLLLNAAMNHRWRTVETLLDKGADPNTTDFEGMNALLRALWSPRALQCIRNISIGKYAKVWLGSAIAFDNPIGSYRQEHAASNYSPDYVTSVITKLITSTLDLEVPGPTGRTALSLAAENGHYATVACLSSRLADSNARDAHGMNPLMWACRHPRFRRLLIENLSVSDFAQVTFGTIVLSVIRPLESSRFVSPLDLNESAVRKERREIVAHLASRTLDLDACDQHGFCALHHAGDQDAEELAQDDFATEHLRRTVVRCLPSIADLLRTCGARSELTDSVNPECDESHVGHAHELFFTPYVKATQRMSNLVIHSGRVIICGDQSFRLGFTTSEASGVALMPGTPSLKAPVAMQKEHGRHVIGPFLPEEMERLLDLGTCLEIPWIKLKDVLIRHNSKFIESMAIASVGSPTIKMLSAADTSGRTRASGVDSTTITDHARAFFGTILYTPRWDDRSDTPFHVLIEGLFRA
jgi:ankyrin repeat protein